MKFEYGISLLHYALSSFTLLTLSSPTLTLPRFTLSLFDLRIRIEIDKEHQKGVLATLGR